MQTATTQFFDEASASSGRFRDEMERTTFNFGHHLSIHPLLAMDALAGLVAYFETNRLACHFEIGDAETADGWAAQPGEVTVGEALRRLPAGDVLIVLKAAHRHPDYARLLEAFFAELAEVMGIDLANRYRTPICTVLLASPGRITPYHMDDSHNLLMQIHGPKTFYVFDGTDPTIVSAPEREAFWSGDNNAARYDSAKQAKAIMVDLGPGKGVHVPMLYPHWAQNGAEISVAMSINFAPLDNPEADLFALNARLKRLGLHPSPPGRSRLVDASKLAAFRTLGSLRRMMPHGAAAGGRL
jgi:hypothetical protein